VSLALLIDSLVRTVQVGSLYALMALGLTLTMAVIKLPNFAHAELITVGAYTALIVAMTVSANPLLVLAAAALAAGLVAIICHKLVFRPLEKVTGSMYTLILASFAVGLILRYVIFLFVDRFDLFDKRIQVPTEVWVQTEWLTLTNVFFWVVPTSLAIVLLLSLILHFTELGREMRALADNPDLAAVVGIPIERIKVLTWLLAGGLAGIGGAMWGMYTFVNPLLGWLVILSVFAATILGGMTSFIGTIIGAYVVAFSENTVMQILNHYAGLDFSFKPAIPFVIIILTLLLRPQGFSGLLDNFGLFKQEPMTEL
jgi:branched-subunit amino acid ABC-type transport system permease component